MSKGSCALRSLPHELPHDSRGTWSQLVGKPPHLCLEGLKLQH
jgi:hypothetical protein